MSIGYKLILRMFEKDIECFWSINYSLAFRSSQLLLWILFGNSLTTRIFPILEHDSSFVDADLVEVVE